MKKLVLVIGILSALLIGCEADTQQEQKEQPPARTKDSFFTGQHELAPFNVSDSSSLYNNTYKPVPYVQISEGRVHYMWKNNRNEFISSDLPEQDVRFTFQETPDNFIPYCRYRWKNPCGCEFDENKWTDEVIYCLIVIKRDQIIRK